MIRLLYTHNPFYLISAVLVLLGVRAAASGQTETSLLLWQIWAALAGFTLLLAVTATLVVRLGKIWEDGRMLALLVILMLVAISSVFDDFAYKQLHTLQWAMLAGGVFALLLCEGLMRGLRLVLPWSYRLPFYALLVLFFAAPAWIPYKLPYVDGIADAHRVLMFPAAAAVIFASLIFAVHQGSNVVRDNGTPWQWPMYPWTIFFFLLLGIVLRTYVLTLTFQTGSGLQSTLAGYYFVPLGFAAALVLYEIGRVERIAGCRYVAIALPAGLLALAQHSGSSPLQYSLIDYLTLSYGSPLWITAMTATAFAIWQLVRRDRAGIGSLAASLAVLAMTPADAIDIGQMRLHSPSLMLLAFSTLLIGGFLLRSSWIAQTAIVASAAFAGYLATVAGEGLWPMIAIVGHAAIALTAVNAWVHRDDFAYWLKTTGLPAVASLAALAAGLLLWRLHPAAVLGYQLAWLLVAWYVAWRSEFFGWMNAVLAIGGWMFVTAGVSGAAFVDSLQLGPAAWLLTLGALSFVIGVAISAVKAGYRPPVIGLPDAYRQHWQNRRSTPLPTGTSEVSVR